MASQSKVPELPILIRKPSDMQEHELDKFETLVVKGGEIDPDDLRSRILNADYLAYVLDNDQIVATGAIKNPTESHKSYITVRSKIDLSSYKKELGYISVESSHREQHLASRITKELLNKVAGSIFATSRVDNVPIHRVLSKYNFMLSGGPWFSQVRNPSRKGIKLCLWTRPRA